MKVQINGTDFEIPRQVEQQLIEQARELIAGEYLKIPEQFRIGMMIPSRVALSWIEKGMKEAGLDHMQARPPKRGDPSLHVLNLLVKSRMEERLKNATLRIDVGTDAQGALAITSVGFTGGDTVSTWGSVAAGGDIGEREDYGSQDAALGLTQPAAGSPPVHL